MITTVKFLIFSFIEKYKLTVSATLTHKYVQVDVDGNNKSDRPEWASARYHAYYSPNAAFELQLQWMVATGPILQDLVNISTDLLFLAFKNELVEGFGVI